MTKFPGRFDIKDWELSDSATRFECGSPNMLGIHALNASLSLIEDVGMEIIQKNVLTNTRYLIDSIKEHSSLELNSPDVPERCSGIVNFLVKGIDSSQVYEKLMKNNVICTLRGNGIRFSPHFYQNHEDLDQSIKIIEKSIK